MEDVLPPQNDPEEPSGDEDNVEEEHAAARDIEDENNKKGNVGDEEYLRKVLEMCRGAEYCESVHLLVIKIGLQVLQQWSLDMMQRQD